MKRIFAMLFCMMALCFSLPKTGSAYTVQYYVKLQMNKNEAGNGKLQLIDTSGKKLPQNNNKNLSTKSYSLNSNGTIKTAEQTVQLYKTEENKSYVSAPSIYYIDKVGYSNNKHYKLSELQYWEMEKETEENPPEGVKSINDLDNVFFTTDKNNEESNGIIITDNTIIRLIYTPLTDNFKSSVEFFDYDISDGNATTDSGVTTMQTERKGINSDSGWKGNGTKLAFGNVNTGTGLGSLTWNGNYLNAYNNGSFQGCTFGLVTGLKDGVLQYAPGVRGKDLFGNTKVTGKTAIQGWKLNFIRTGDTYTLSYVSDDDGNKVASAKDLNKLTNPSDKYHDIWTNNFWPMDAADTYGASGHDIKFGDSNKLYERLYDGEEGTKDNLPEGDDGKDHNSYFGMTFSVDFTLTADYYGPLEYTFFGDDDMWVFLEDSKGKTTLVCDIGGVHSSVGQYVNLRDYLPNGTEGDYKLHFFYTERGASGSTCYMQFTLPSVNSPVPTAQYGDLQIKKNVKASDQEKAFTFEIEMKDENGKYYKNNLACTVDNEDKVLANEGNGKYKVALKDGQTVLLKHLSVGSTYKITEVPDESYQSSISSGKANGKIEAAGQTYSVVYTNTKLVDLNILKLREGTKVPLSGAAFTLTHNNSACCKDEISKLTSGTTDSEGKTSITGILVGHTYTLTETQTPSGHTAHAPMTVVVRENETITVDGKPYDAQLTVENKQIFIGTSAKFTASKIMDGGEPAEGAFEFELVDEKGNVLETVKNTADGSVAFSKIEFPSAGTYTYTIHEKNGADAYIDYDPSEYTVTVVVKDKATDGSVQLAVDSLTYKKTGGTETTEPPVFVNTTEKKAELNILKVSGYAGNAPMKDIVFTLTHTADCCNAEWDEEKIAVTTDAKGKAKIEKILAGHQYTLTESNTPEDYIVQGPWTVTVDEDGVVKVSGRTTDANGNVTVMERQFDPDQTMKVINYPVYTPDGVILTASKTLDGEAPAEGQFTFQLLDSDGKVLDTKTNDAAGSVTFEPIEYRKAGVYRYVIREAAGNDPTIAYDAAIYDVTVTVEKTGIFNFNNSQSLKARVVYQKRGTEEKPDTAAFANATYERMELTLVKQSSYDQRALAGAKFTLAHDDEDCALCQQNGYDGTQIAPQSGTTDQSGKLTFASLILGHQYILTETQAPADYLLPQKNTWIVRMTESGAAVDGEIVPGELAIENRPELWPVEIVLEAAKLMDRMPPEDDQVFTFKVTDAAGKVKATAQNRQESVVFPPIVFEKPGTYTLTMSEVQGEDYWTLYDEEVYTVTVVVTEGEGNLLAQVTYEKDGEPCDDVPTFENWTKPELPETGDDSQILLWGALLTLSAGAGVWLMRKRRS